MTHSIFTRFIYKINNSPYIPPTATFTIEILSCIQIVHIIFQTMSYSSSNSAQFIISGISRNLCFLTGAFQLSENSYYASVFHPIWFLIAAYFLAHLLLFTFAVQSCLSKENMNKNLVKLISLLYLLHSRILFFPIQFFLLNIINLYRTDSFFAEPEFYQRAGWLIGTILLAVINTAFAFSREFILYSITKTANYYDVKTNLYHQITIIYKLVALILYYLCLAGISVAVKINSFLHLFTALLLMSVLYIKIPFYWFKMLHLVIINTAIILCLSFLSIIDVMTHNWQVIGGMQILIIILPSFFAKITLAQFRALFLRILNGSVLFPEHSVHFALLIEEFIANIDYSSLKNKHLLPNVQKFYGILSDNKIDLAQLKNKKTRSECEPEIYSFLIEKFGRALDRYPKSKILPVFIAQIYLLKLDNIPRALEMIRKIESFSLSSPLKSTLEYIYALLEDTYAKEDLGSESRLGLSHYFKYYEITSDIRKEMLKETNQHIQFWEDIKKPEFDVKKAMIRAQSIDALFTKICRECDLNLNNFRKNFTSPMLLYAVYLNNIRQLCHEGAQIIRSFQSVMVTQNINNEFDAASGTTAVIIISLDKIKAGQILDASGSIHNLFNLKKTDLIGKRFGSLFPSGVAKRYQLVVSQYAKAPVYKLNYKEKTYGKTVDDEIFELEAHFQLYPYINKEITVMILLKRLSKPLPILIANPEGIITDYSKRLKKAFQKEFLNLNNFRTLQSLSLEFEEVNLAFNMIHNKQQASEQQSIKDFLFKDKMGVPTVLDFDETSRQSSRSLIKTSGVFTDRIKSFRAPSTDAISIPVERAQQLCDALTQGKLLILCTNNSSPSRKKKYQIRAQARVKPFLIEGDVHKVVSLTKLKKDPIIVIVSNPESEVEDSFHDLSAITFADEFPITNEMALFKMTPNERAKNITTVVSSYVELNKKNTRTDEDDTSNHQTEDKDDKFDFENRFNKGEDQKSSILNSNYRESRVVRSVKEVGARKKQSAALFYLQFILYLIIALMFALAIIKFILSKDSILEIEKGINIIYTSTLRLQTAINTWQFALVLSTGSTGFSSMATAIKNLAVNLTDYNVQLKTQLAAVTNNDLLERAFVRDIKYWELPVAGDTNNNIVDTFTATDLLINKYLKVGKTTNIYQFMSIPDIQLTFNNTGNDYLISSRLLISQTGVILQEIISSDIIALKAVLAVEMIALASITTIFIIVAILIMRSYKRLGRALTRMQEFQVNERIGQLQKTKVLLEDDIERKDFIQDAFDLFTQERSKIALRLLKKAHRNIGPARNYNMTRLNRELLKLIGSALVFVPLFVGLFIGTLVKSINTFYSLESVNDQISLLSNGCYLSNMLMSSLVYTIVFRTSPTMLIRNQQPIMQVNETIQEFNTLNPALIDAFLTPENGEVDPYLQDILQTKTCDYLDSVSKLTCEVATNGRNVGLLSMNTEYYNLITYIASAVGSTSSLAQAIILFSSLLNKILGDMTALEGIYPLMIAHIIKQFASTVQGAVENEETFFVIICAAIAVYALFIYFKPLRGLKKVDLGRRKILRIIPFHLVQENKALKYYLIQDFKKEIEDIRSVL